MCGEKLYLQGRIVAVNESVAAAGAEKQIRAKGCRPIGGINMFPCPVQPYCGEIWWEWVAEVEKMPAKQQHVKK